MGQVGQRSGRLVARPVDSGCPAGQAEVNGTVGLGDRCGERFDAVTGAACRPANMRRVRRPGR